MLIIFFGSIPFSITTSSPSLSFPVSVLTVSCITNLHSTTFEMASNQETGHGSGYEKSLLWLSDDVLIKTLINLTLEERIRIERTSKRIKALIDRILSLQKIFAMNPRNVKSVLMKSWSPLQSPVFCSKASLIFDTLPWLGIPSSPSILSRCSSVKLVNLDCVDVCGTDLATWCPFITHLVTDNLAIAADYVQELIKNKKDVLIESFEYLVTSSIYFIGDIQLDSDSIEMDMVDQPLPTGPDADFSFLSNCSRLNTLICPGKYHNIPADVLSKVKISFFVNDAKHVDNLIKYCSKNVAQLTITRKSYLVPVQLIADNSRSSHCNRRLKPL